MWQLMLLGMLLTDTLGNSIAKYWSLRGGWHFALLAMLCFVGTNIFLLFALKDGSGLARALALFGVGTLLLGTLVALLVYHETLTGKQWLGVLLGIASIVMLG